MPLTKIDRKILTILIIVLLLAIFAGFLVLKYIAGSAKDNIQNYIGGASLEN